MQEFFSQIALGIIKLIALPTAFILTSAGYNLAPPVPVPSHDLDIYSLQEQVNDLKANQSLVQAQNQKFGASNPVETSVAFFSTALQTGISASDTSFTLQSASYNNGANTLASSTYSFVLDEGSANQELVLADCTSITCTNVERGLDFLTGTSSVTSLKFAHRRGASVKITTAPIVLKLDALALGRMKYPGVIKYNAIATTTVAADRDNLASVGLVQDTAFAGAGVINATTAAKGIVELATAIETASSTATGSSGASLAVTSSNATSSCDVSTLCSLKVIVTQNDGTIDNRRIATTTILGPALTISGRNATFTGTTTMASTTINTITPFGESISTTTTVSALTSMTLSAIPSYPKDLVFKIFATTSPAAATNGFVITMNGDSGSNYVTSGGAAATSINIFPAFLSTDGEQYIEFRVRNASGGQRLWSASGAAYMINGNIALATSTGGVYRSPSLISSITVSSVTASALGSGSYIKLLINSQ